MFKKKRGSVAYEFNETTGGARITTSVKVIEMPNAIEARNSFKRLAL